MKESRVASRYAKSLIDLSIERGQLESVSDDMSLIRAVVDENRDLKLMIDSPIINADKKLKVLHQIFAGKIGEITQKFIGILVTKNRVHLVDDVAEEFESQYRISKDIVSAEVISALPLTDDLRDKVLSIVKTLDSRPGVDLVEKVDKDIIGGMIVRVGDKQLDYSVIGRLEKYRQEFSKNQYIADL
jgi:F-type H+-transporting ATPase subunit delta